MVETAVTVATAVTLATAVTVATAVAAATAVTDREPLERRVWVSTRVSSAVWVLPSKV